MPAGGLKSPHRLTVRDRWHHTGLAPEAQGLCILFEKRGNIVESEIGHKPNFDTTGLSMEAKCNPARNEDNSALPVREQKADQATGLLEARGLAEALCPDPRARPCVRTVRQWQKMRLIPFIKIGGKVLFDPVQVRRALDSRFTVAAR